MDEVRNEALEEAIRAVNGTAAPVHGTPYSVGGKRFADAIEKLKSQSVPAGADPQGNQPQTQQVLTETAVPGAKEISPQEETLALASYLDEWITGWLGKINRDISDSERAEIADDMAGDWFGAGVGASVRDQLASLKSQPAPASWPSGPPSHINDNRIKGEAVLGERCKSGAVRIGNGPLK